MSMLDTSYLGYKYPTRTDQHMIQVKNIVETHHDQHYPYVDRSWYFMGLRYVTNVLLLGFGFLLATVKLGLRIEGRVNIRSQELRKHAAITVCNHVFMWDYLCVLKAIRPKMQYHPAWPINLHGTNRHLIRLVGGVPIPHDIRALAVFNKQFSGVLRRNWWMHFFPEASMWNYYNQIRPFKKGCFRYAVRYNAPIVPMAISYREPTGLYKKLGRKLPLATLRIGQPLFPDTSLPFGEAIVALHKATYHQVQLLAGIEPGDPNYHTYEQAEQWALEAQETAAQEAPPVYLVGK